MRPAFKELARLKGLKFKEINVDHCKTKTCDGLEYVPTVFIGSKKLDFEDMEKELKDI